MTTFSIELTDEVARKLTAKAQERGVAVEDWLRDEAERMADAEDERFKAIADHILKKNAELYRRLA